MQRDHVHRAINTEPGCKRREWRIFIFIEKENWISHIKSKTALCLFNFVLPRFQHRTVLVLHNTEHNMAMPVHIHSLVWFHAIHLVTAWNSCHFESSWKLNSLFLLAHRDRCQPNQPTDSQKHTPNSLTHSFTHGGQTTRSTIPAARTKCYLIHR